MNTIKQGTHTVQPEKTNDWPTDDNAKDAMGLLAIVFLTYVMIACLLTWRKHARRWGHKRA